MATTMDRKITIRVNDGIKEKLQNCINEEEGLDDISSITRHLYNEYFKFKKQEQSNRKQQELTQEMIC